MQSNIFIAPDGSVKIGDFGLATNQGVSLTSDANSSSTSSSHNNDNGTQHPDGMKNNLPTKLIPTITTGSGKVVDTDDDILLGADDVIWNGDHQEDLTQQTTGVGTFLYRAPEQEGNYTIHLFKRVDHFLEDLSNVTYTVCFL
jgi:serine/threonine protein kinase